MTMLDESEQDSTDAEYAEVAAEPANRDDVRTRAEWVRLVFGVLAVIGVLYLLYSESKARSTLVTVVVAVAACALIWIGANMLFNQVRDRWQRFVALLYGTVTLIVTGVLSGNRALGNLPEDDPVAKTVNRLVNGIRAETLTTEGFVPEFFAWLWIPFLLSIGAAAVGFGLSRTDGLGPRLAIGAGGLGALGVVTGALFNFLARPEIDALGLIAWTALGAGVATGLGVLRDRDPIRSALLGATFGWVVGAFGAPEVGGGPAGWTVVAVAVPPLLIGVRAAIRPNLELRERGMISNDSRKWIFLGPALLFTLAMLVVPTITTIWLSLKGRDGTDYVGVENYRSIFGDSTSWNPPEDWRDIFSPSFFTTATGGSALMIIGLIVLVIFAIVGARQKVATGRVVELGSPSMGPLIIGALFVLLAVVTTFRGTIINNLWWVVIVTLVSTAVGLAIAVLADGIRFEKVAKSVIFMPMAISLVGASVIWRFMYVARDSSTEQTGVLNSLWVALGRISTGTAVATVAIVILGAVIAIAGFMSISGRRPDSRGMVGGAAFLLIGALAIAGLVWVLAARGTISMQHEVIAWVLVGLATVIALGAIVLAVVRDWVGAIAGMVYLPVAGAVLWGIAWLWGGQVSGSVQKGIVGAVAIALFVVLLVVVARALTKRNWGAAALPAVVAGLVGWFTLRYFAVWGGGVGGQEINTVGNVRDDPINFIQDSPWNSVFLMIVLIWIQTGFAMVILSAAIKAVPTELIEAAKVDGATDSQVFWRVTLPQIGPTIGVVVTTIVVLVMKVYDIVNVMTNGNFETQVLANDFYNTAFSDRNQGQGAALAILIFVSVLPVMVFNIRKMQKES